MVESRRISEPRQNISNSEVAVKTIEPVIAVLVIACNRVDYIKQTLDELLK